jgi:hypothetical protein
VSVIGQDEGIKHGTHAGYKQHLYRQVAPCKRCLKALSEYNARRTPRPRKPKPNQQQATPQRDPDFGVAHGDTAREPALTYIPYLDEEGRALQARERAAAALAVAARSRSATDCLALLSMLGLLDTVGGDADAR